jgi:hypothetical protein
MQTEPCPDLTRLRLAAALTHQLPAIALTIWPGDGPSVVVARDCRHQPDLSACALRRLVRAAMVGEEVPLALRWLLDAEGLTVDGVGVRHVGDGVVAVGEGERPGRWWPTLLDTDALVAALSPADDLVEGAEVAAHVDAVLGVTLVELRTPPGSVGQERRADRLARSLARTCVISELLEATSSSSTR